MNNAPMNQHKLMMHVKALDFAVMEAGLFLDTHPTDRKALAYFNAKNEERQAAYDQYVDTYGPLTIYDCSGTESWDWVKDPWPWEMED